VRAPHVVQAWVAVVAVIYRVYMELGAASIG
jgi:hypothetical protein